MSHETNIDGPLVPVGTLAKHLSTIIGRVADSEESVIVTRHGKPIVAIVAIDGEALYREAINNYIRDMAIRAQQPGTP